MLPLVFLLIALVAASAQAADFKFNTAPEVGYVWFFAYDSRATAVRINPALCYGGTIFQIIDFDWSRNMVFELNYLYSLVQGSQIDWENTGAANDFEMSWHQAAANVGYQFEGRRLHPYLSGGLGASFLSYVDQAKNEQTEQDFTLNLGGGVDYTVWETGTPALDRLDLGLRIRYYYISQKAITDVALNAVSMTLRLNLRW